jgi:hypothetical protein
VSGLHHDRLVEGSDVEGRVANLLLAVERGEATAELAVDWFKWAAKNWIAARAVIVEAAKLSPDPDVQRVLSEGLEVIDDV